jgi:DNA repair protein RecO
VEQIRDLAVVLRWVAFEERHRIVTALTENHGKISALARNSIQSRRFGGTLEPFTASEWRFVERTGADLYRVEGTELKRSFDGIRKDFQRLALASTWSEIMLRAAPEREACPDLFKLHTNALAVLEELPTDARPGTEIALLVAYMAKVLQWAGNQPQIQNCLGCEKPLKELEPHGDVTCIISEAAWLCPNCRNLHAFHLRVAPIAVGDFLMCMTTPIRQVPAAFRAKPVELKALFKFLEALVVFHLPGFDKSAMKSLRFLELD